MGIVGAAVGTGVADGTDAQILKPTPCGLVASEWNANLVTPVTASVDGNAVEALVPPQYLVPPLTCR